MKSKRAKIDDRASSLVLIRLAYLVTLAIWLLSSYLPDFRIWGIRIWAFLPLWAPPCLFLAGLLGLAAEYLISRSGGIEANGQRMGRTEYWSGTLAAVVGILVFSAAVLFPRTHFLGDGYQLLAALAADNPFVKLRDFGSLFLPNAVMHLVGEPNEESALLAFRTISWLAGLSLMATLVWQSWFLFQGSVVRKMFVMLLATSGSVVLFFGYVEVYALPILAIVWFLILGIRVIRHEISKYWLLVPITFGALLHILSISLVPAALYAIFRDSPVGGAFARRTKVVKSAMIAAILAVPIIVFMWLYQSELNFRLTFIPLFADLTTVNGYTLFSWQHILDTLNLYFLAIPPLILYGLVFLRRIRSKKEFCSEEIFLALTAISYFIIFFVIDPRLGMPRDWDLFSMASIPVLFLLVWIVLHADDKTVVSTAILAAVLSILCIVPRAVVLGQPGISIKQAEYYFALDPGRSRAGLTTLAEYFAKAGDSTSSQRVRSILDTRYPGVQMIYSARSLMDQGRFIEAKRTLLDAVRLNSTFADAWLMLSRCYVAEQRLDSAIDCALISDGLNPYNPATGEQIAFLYFSGNRLDDARDVWMDLSQRDTSWASPLYGLACVAKRQGDLEQYSAFLVRAEMKQTALPQFSQELAEHYASRQMFREAALALSRARQRGLQPAMIERTLSHYPRLLQWMNY